MLFSQNYLAKSLILQSVHCIEIQTFIRTFLEPININKIITLAQTREIGLGLGRILSCGACKPEQT